MYGTTRDIKSFCSPLSKKIVSFSDHLLGHKNDHRIVMNYFM